MLEKTLQQQWRTRLTQLGQLAQQGNFAEFSEKCRAYCRCYSEENNILLDIGALLLQTGFLSLARTCFERARELAPQDLRPVINLANAAREAGHHAEAKRLYARLVAQLPNLPLVQRNALVSQEYDPAVSDAERLARAKAWGAWAEAGAGGPHPRPPLAALAERPLRIGYLSADFCQHTVGLFVKDVLREHDPAAVTVFTYGAGQVQDWVTDAIRAVTDFRDVRALDDTALAGRIRADALDVLIDLSGHTAGSRLTVFAHRPAPVQVSWLGYFATTGLSCMDAVLLDAWHAPPGMERYFVEKIVRLPGGRFCYQPVPWAPGTVSPAPCLATGRVTFGCFNNTAKCNDGVFAVWADILAATPGSRLVLKWRTLHDGPLCAEIREAFARRGIDPERVELRGPSFHADLLKEYADIDIALDPFPFTGGLTSCEALWMGVPVVTWPQSRVVSRQTYALLGAIGLEELAATSAAQYLHIAVALARDVAKLRALRAGLRTRMRASGLMDVRGFTRGLEQALRQCAEHGQKGSSGFPVGNGAQADLG